MKTGWRDHWPEYLMEAAGLGLFMVSACVFGALLEHPGSPVRQALGDATLRRALMGVAMGGTAVAIIHSPWGQRSGAHINPAVTLAFLRLGKLAPADAGFYMLAQFVGALAGVLVSAALLGPALADPRVNYVVTLPGAAGIGVAFAAEVAMTFGLMAMVLVTTNGPPGLARLTGWFAGALVAVYIAVEAPVSGMSLNPARSLGSAVPARMYTALWLYFVAPVLGMLLAAEAFVWIRGRAAVRCAKLDHDNPTRCIHCGKPAA